MRKCCLGLKPSVALGGRRSEKVNQGQENNDKRRNGEIGTNKNRKGYLTRPTFVCGGNGEGEGEGRGDYSFQLFQAGLR